MFFFSSRRRHSRWTGGWSSDVCSSDLPRRGREKMITCVRGKTSRVLLFLAGLICTFTAPAAFSAPTDCVEDAPDDGRLLCLRRYPTPLQYGLCDEAADFASRRRAWCE